LRTALAAGAAVTRRAAVTGRAAGARGAAAAAVPLFVSHGRSPFRGEAHGPSVAPSHLLTGERRTPYSLPPAGPDDDGAAHGGAVVELGGDLAGAAVDLDTFHRIDGDAVQRGGAQLRAHAVHDVLDLAPPVDQLSAARLDARIAVGLNGPAQSGHARQHVGEVCQL